MMKKLIIKNLEEQFSLVTDSMEKPFAYSHSKYGFLGTDPDDSEVTIHPISEDGLVDYGVSITKKRNEITPRFVKIVPK